MTPHIPLIFQYILPFGLAVLGFWGLTSFTRLDQKAGAWLMLQLAVGVFLLQLAFENPAAGSTGANPFVLSLGVMVALTGLLVFSLLLGLAIFLKRQNGSWDGDEINRRLKP